MIPRSGRLFALELDAGGNPQGEWRSFAKISSPGIPDGATADADGHVWVAIYDGWRLERYSPSGERVRVIEMPVQKPTSCAFGGPELKTLFVTTASQGLSAECLAAQPLAGALLAFEPGGAGVPEPVLKL